MLFALLVWRNPQERIPPAYGNLKTHTIEYQNHLRGTRGSKS